MFQRTPETEEAFKHVYEGVEPELEDIALLEEVQASKSAAPCPDFTPATVRAEKHILDQAVRTDPNPQAKHPLHLETKRMMRNRSALRGVRSLA